MKCNNLNNYKLVSNLAFLYKNIVWAVDFHLNTYLPTYNHSGENDTMISIEQGSPLLLVLKNLSTSFDKVDHNVLLYSLKDI